MGVRCFWLEPTNRDRRYLRRFTHADCIRTETKCHDARVRIEDAPALRDEQGFYVAEDLEPYSDDPRWPTHCPCGYAFKPDDPYQIFREHLYRRPDTGDEMPLSEAPPGAMWDAWWMADIWHGDDGLCIVVKAPNSLEWVIDSQASNCTIPDDHSQQQHHCWVRKGAPPNITVGKDGKTCNAGAGSIQIGDYHGFLRNGEFEP